jgi:hypothetical protein
MVNNMELERIFDLCWILSDKHGKSMAQVSMDVMETEKKLYIERKVYNPNITFYYGAVGRVSEQYKTEVKDASM